MYDWWEALHLHRWRWGGESVTREFMNIFPLLFCCVWVLYQVLYLRCVQMRSDSFAGQFLLIVWLCYIQYLSGFFSLSPSVVDIMHKTYPLQYSLWHISFFGQEIFDERNDPAGCFHHSCLVSFEILSLFLIICKIKTQSECPTAKAARYFIGQMMEQVTDGHWNGQIIF